MSRARRESSSSSSSDERCHCLCEYRGPNPEDQLRSEAWPRGKFSRTSGIRTEWRMAVCVDNNNGQNSNRKNIAQDKSNASKLVQNVISLADRPARVCIYVHTMSFARAAVHVAIVTACRGRGTGDRDMCMKGMFIGSLFHRFMSNPCFHLARNEVEQVRIYIHIYIFNSKRSSRPHAQRSPRHDARIATLSPFYI